jgi:hypothetical protein
MRSIMSLSLAILFLWLVGGGIQITAIAGEILFVDRFDRADLGPDWEIVHPPGEEWSNWSVEDGVLKQATEDQMAAARPEGKAVVVAREFPDELTIVAKMRIDEWEDGDHARAGVALRVSMAEDGTGGEGYNLVFHRTTSGLAFLDDHVVWGQEFLYQWEIDTWYWFLMYIDGNDELYGKVWEDGDEEPDELEFEQVGWTGREGPPGLNGGKNFTGFSFVSFDDVIVAEGSPPVDIDKALAVESNGKLTTTWGQVKGE